MAECSVRQRLVEEAFVFDFFQAVRLLHRAAPERALVGYTGPPAAEVVRFKALPSLNFPASSVYEITQPAGNDRLPRMTVTFLGLTGPSGVLPRHYTELILRLERERKGEERRALRDWLDLFNHRLLSLFYRAWDKYRFWIHYERGEQAEPDAFTRALYSFVGVGTGHLRNRLEVRAGDPDHARPLAGVADLTLVHYAGLLSQRKRNASGLEALVGDYFGVPVRVQQFVGQWLALEPENQTRLGVPDGNADLGVNTVAGERVFDVQGKIRLRLGPLRYDQFVEFLPDRAPVAERKAFFLLSHLVRLYGGAELDVDVQLLLQAEAVPECQLADGTPGPLLGWNTWLISQPPGEAAGDALFPADEVVRVDDTFAIRI